MVFKVVIDPGHGSIDTGTSYGNILEKEINLKIAQHLSNELKKVNIIPIMTRIEDKLYLDSRNKDIRRRVEITKESKADLYISIHANNFPSSQPAGSQVFYKPDCPLSKTLADFIKEELIKLRSENNRSIKNGNFYVLNGSPCPAVLIEAGFLSNPEDRRLLSNPGYQNSLAKAIKNGIIMYFQSNFNQDQLELPVLDQKKQRVTDRLNNVYYLDVKNGKITYYATPIPRPVNNLEIKADLNVYQNLDLYNEQIAISAIHELMNPPKNLISTLPRESQILSLKIVNGVAVIDFSEKIRDHFQGGAGTELYLLETLAHTLFSIPAIEGIEILINGKRGSSIGGHIFLKQIWKSDYYYHH